MNKGSAINLTLEIPDDLAGEMRATGGDLSRRATGPGLTAPGVR
jgi:hypothetical protein